MEYGTVLHVPFNRKKYAKIKSAIFGITILKIQLQKNDNRSKLGPFFIGKAS
jgi:hypothetical protein